MKKLLFTAFLITISALLLFGLTAVAADDNSVVTYNNRQSTEDSPIVSLEGKTVFIVGNSHLFYGNCVLYGDSGKADKGYLYNIIKSFGENAKVVDHTYAGKSLEQIYNEHLSKINSDTLRNVDFVILSEAAKSNKDPVDICKRIRALFPESTQFFFASHPLIYDRNIEAVYNSFGVLRQEGFGIIDWGRLIYDIYTKNTEVPGGVMKYNRLSFIKDNVRYDKNTNTTTGDNKHPNPLSGYIATQAIYTAITNRTAVFTDYSFCGNKKLSDRYDFDTFIAKHYNTGNHTNFDKVFMSSSDMAGIQKLIDIYNEKENRHAVYKAEGVRATCLSSGLTDGYHCTVCGEIFKTQQLIPAMGEHTPIYKNGVSPTCKKDGSTAEIRCSTCSILLVKSKKLSALGHSYTEKIIDDKHLVSPASYSSAAVYRYDCARCSSTSSKYTFTYGSRLSLGSPKQLTAVQTLKTVSLSWSKVKKADGYRIKQYDNKTDSWVKLADTQSRSFTVKELSSGKKYDFRVYAYIKEGGKKAISKTYKEIGTATKPKNISDITSKQTVSSITLMWNKVKGATGYNIYQNDNGTWKKLASTDSLTYKITNLKAGKSYRFSVRPYIKTSSGKVFSPSGYKYETAAKPTEVTVSKLFASEDTVRITWNDVKNESGYQVYYSEHLAGPYKKLGDYKSNITFAMFTDIRSSYNYFKVRAYKKTVSGTVYGAFSEIKSVKIK